MAETAADQPATTVAQRKHHVCPWWIGYLLLSPIRRLRESPETILASRVEPGMTAIDIGCAMGYFSLPLARMVGDAGRVVCVDVQQRMLAALSRRARRKGLERIIETRLCTQDGLGLDDLTGQADLILAAHVVHETAYPRSFLAQCHEALRPGGALLLLEPKGHVSDEEFSSTCALVSDVGFSVDGSFGLKSSRSLVLAKPERREGACHLSQSHNVEPEELV